MNTQNAKAEFEARLEQLEPSVATALKNGTLQLVDSVIYSAKTMTGTKQELMEAADNKVVGKTNINNRKLEANCYMLITGIQILTSSINDATGSLEKATWTALGTEYANGEFELRQGDKVLFPKNSLAQFVTGSVTDRLAGFKVLECPKMLIPLTEIIPEITLPANATIHSGSSSEAATVAFKVVLYGVRTNSI